MADKISTEKVTDFGLIRIMRKHTFGIILLDETVEVFSFELELQYPKRYKDIILLTNWLVKVLLLRSLGFFEIISCKNLLY